MNEILGLERLGLKLRIYAIDPTDEGLIQPQIAKVRAPVAYLGPARKRSQREKRAEAMRLLKAGPAGYLSAWIYVWLHPQLDQGYTASSRWENFEDAIHLANLILDDPTPITHLHAHFAHDPSLVAQLVHRIIGIPFTFTAHARDLYQTPKSMLRDRIREAKAVVTCCNANLEYLNQVASTHPPIHLVPHGVDLGVFQPPSNGTRMLDPRLILSAGRLVEKKGFPDLIQALRMLSLSGQRFSCEIYGDGPLRDKIAGMIQAYGMEEQVHLLGAYRQEQLAPALQRASLFVLTPRIPEDGDRDGIPNVIGEAMACEVPVVSTNVAGIPELVEDRENGLLFPPGEIEAIAEGIGELLNDEPTRWRLGLSARRTVEERFDQQCSAEQMAQLFCS